MSAQMLEAVFIRKEYEKRCSVSKGMRVNDHMIEASNK